MLITWFKGMITHRYGRILGAACGVALTVSLLSLISSFIILSGASMTEQAIRNNAVDWQVQTIPGADSNKVLGEISKAVGYSVAEKVGYADTAGLEASTGGTVQTTGAGKVLGISDTYIKNFPGEIRLLSGSDHGVLIAQQTAANLHARTGDFVTIKRYGLPDARVQVDGIVDLPNADSLFQAIGLPVGAAPQAPPDNVILLPQNSWHQIFDAQVGARPDTVGTQLHVKINHSFSTDPNIAYAAVQSKANNVEARIAGSAIIGDNLAARLAAVRQDAFYAKILFLFLGFPGVLLAVLLTIILLASGARRRNQECSILRVRGATNKQILALESLEALTVSVAGVLAGILITKFAGQYFIGHFSLMNGAALISIGVAVLAGFILVFAAILIPVWKQVRYSTAVSAKAIRGAKKPLWLRAWADVIILAIGAVEFWRVAGTGYQVVLAPEGVTAISVNYEAFIAPLCLWVGGMLLVARLCRLYFEYGRGLLVLSLKPVSGRLSTLVAASISRERGLIIRGIVLTALAVSFAVSTSLFNTTYNTQARVDAQLTNGADVTATALTPVARTDSRINQLKSLHGVTGVQFMQHRFAYVGNDLQDIYGVDPLHIQNATSISNAYFASGDAKATLSALAQNQDGVLVSEETVKDFQLQPGDTINLRLQSASDHQYHVIPFHFVGVVREFPTAPTDSFLVANSSYIARMTGSDTVETVLLRTSGSPAELAGQAGKTLGSMDFKVSDIGSVQKTINSSLTSVDLNGLTAIELLYAVLLVAGAIGLLLGLGMSERKRSFAILQALGAKDRQLGVFIWSEGLLVLAAGGLIGILLGTGIAQTLVKILTGVFDPPPQFLAVPWAYLCGVAFAAILSTVLTIYLLKRIAHRPAVEVLRNIE